MENKIAIIIVNWNSTEDTLNCLKSLPSDHNIIIVDNGSTQGQVQLLEKNIPPNIHLITNITNLGFAAGNNQGIKYAIEKYQSDYIMLLNSDTIASPNFLEPLVSLMEKDNKIGAIQPKILNMQNKKIIDSAGHIAYSYGSIRDRGIGKPDSSKYNIQEEIQGACGASSLYRVSALKETGLFDERLFCLFEDVDLSWRMKQKGYKIFYEPASVVYHKRGVSGKIQKNNKILRRFYGFRNCLYINLKYYPKWKIILFSPVHIYRFLTALFFKLKYKITAPLFLSETAPLSQRPTVLHIYNSYFPPLIGGIEKHINTLCEGLKDKFQIKVLVAGNKPFTTIENINGIEIIRAGAIGRIQSAPISFLMPVLLNKIKADIIHFHLPCPTGIISYFMTRPRAKLIVTYHSDIVRQKWANGVYTPLLNKFLEKADHIIATSQNYINISPFLTKFKNKCEVIPLGIDTSRFYEGVPDEPTILFVGKLRYYKGLDYLIQAMENIDAKLLIVGAGNEKNKLKKLASKLNLNHKIRFLGEVSEEKLPYYYSKCSVFVLPSTEKSEAFGIVQLEAMASGKPVVSTNLPTGVPWVNQNGITGVIVPPKDSKALADAINKLLKDDSLRERLGKNAKLRAEKEFNKEKMLDQVSKLYTFPAPQVG